MATWLWLDGDEACSFWLLGQGEGMQLYRPTNPNRMRLYYLTTEASEFIEDPEAPPVGQWVYYAGTVDYDAAADRAAVVLYRDGVAVDQAEVAGVPRPDTGCGWYAGGVYTGRPGCQGWGYWLQGRIDEAMVFSRPLSEDEVAGLYALGRADPDADGVCGASDVCPAFPDPDQTDTDGDGVGDACDLCPDNGGLADLLPEGAVAWWEAEGDANDSVGASHGVAMDGAAYAAGGSPWQLPHTAPAPPTHAGAGAVAPTSAWHGVSEQVPAAASQAAPSPASVTSAGGSESRWPGASIVSGTTWQVSQP